MSEQQQAAAKYFVDRAACHLGISIWEAKKAGLNLEELHREWKAKDLERAAVFGLTELYERTLYQVTQ